ncbi:MAG TPA: selenide, water dikinase SelD, partial [Chromatiaceae bacterium]|nr:selenide, water dikinase SelD [Chromatiaceae bacterium]
KQKKIAPEHLRIAPESMCQLNRVGTDLGRLEGVSAMTDVTGFGLLGHLLEICQGSDLAATLDYRRIPRLPQTTEYLAQGCSPGGAERNFASYGEQVAPLSDEQRQLLCDPQTSGGLLVAVDPNRETEFLEVVSAAGLTLSPIGHLHEWRGGPRIEVR